MNVTIKLALPLMLLSLTACQANPVCSNETCGDGTVCNADTGQCEVGEDPGTETTESTNACTTNADCEDSTQRCDNGECVSNCEGVVCNEAAGEVCDPTSGLCVGGAGACNIDEDCEDGQLCEENVCVGDRYAACDEDAPCSSTLSCRYGVGFSFCVETCESNDTCFGYEFCVPEGMPGLQDFTSHCFWNTCAPGGGVNNTMQDAQWLAPCDVAALGDAAGSCYGPFDNGSEEFGWCLAQRGGAALGEDCLQEARQGDAMACSEGICAFGSNVCSNICGIDDGLACSESGDSACYPQASPNGVCYPTVENPPGLGEPCSGDGDLMPCQDDLLCGYPNGDPNEPMACVEICDSKAAVGGPASCQEGQTCYIFDTVNTPRAGICITL